MTSIVELFTDKKIVSRIKDKLSNFIYVLSKKDLLNDLLSIN